MTREEAIECIEAIHVQMFNSGNSKWTKACDMAIEALNRPHGKWIYVHPLQEDDGGAYMCSVCKTGDWNIRGDENFCSNCGADMREGEVE